MKPERWGSPLVQEKYQAGKACDKRHPYRIIIIIIIIKIIIIIIIIAVMCPTVGLLMAVLCDVIDWRVCTTERRLSP